MERRVIYPYFLTKLSPYARKIEKGEAVVRFEELHPDGRQASVRHIPMWAITRCPHMIMVPEHYRDDDVTCRCDDPTHIEMKEWEYEWDGERWS